VVAFCDHLPLLRGCELEHEVPGKRLLLRLTCSLRRWW
jgi:hypothetical protein